MAFRNINPAEQDIRTNYHLMISGIVPRPIALVSTLDAEGKGNLAPFSFFNGFGANPPVVGFSPAYSGRTGEAKDTLLNIRETKEFTISIVSYAMAEQMSIASIEFPRGVDEFVKAGFGKHPSEKVAPPGVEESPFIMECRLMNIIGLGGKPASGNLILGEILMFHVAERILGADGRIDPALTDPVGRLGYSWYERSKKGLFALSRPSGQGIGFDNLPPSILKSEVLTGSRLARLTSIDRVPDYDAKYDDYPTSLKVLHEMCGELIDTGKIEEAWQVALRIQRLSEGDGEHPSS